LKDTLWDVIDLIILKLDASDPLEKVERRGWQGANLVVAKVEMSQVG